MADMPISIVDRSARTGRLTSDEPAGSDRSRYEQDEPEHAEQRLQLPHAGVFGGACNDGGTVIEVEVHGEQAVCEDEDGREHQRAGEQQVTSALRPGRG
jgi:hypothetical protein